MQRKSEELQLAVQEYLDVDWTSVKFYLRRQIAKCVQECKSQASNAKRIAKNLKHSHSAQSGGEEYNGTCDSEVDSDDWGSDFEDDSEDEVKDEQYLFEVNNNTIIQSVSDAQNKNPCSSVLPTINLEEKSIPKPPDVPVISKSVNGSLGFKSSSLTNSIPRPPVKRPPSQPPPPPVPQVASHDEPQEDYEIPIVSTSSCGKENCSFSDTNSQLSLTIENSMPDTYEIVEPPEENYETVDPLPVTTSYQTSMIDKPLIPPRNTKGLGNISPPPLPQKPQKLKESLSGGERHDGIRTFSRPKLPVKTDNDTQSEINHSSSSSSLSNVGFISSLIGRRPSTPSSSSPKMQHKSKDLIDSIAISPSSLKLSNDNLSSCSTSPDRDGSAILEGKKMPPLPPLPPRGALSPVDDTVQNMATRPLPPVPEPKEEEKPIKQDIHLYPWFHEIEREEAEAVVRKLNEPGSFVVRPSKRAGKENPYSLTVLHEDKLFHLNIRHRPDDTFALGKEKEKEKTFESVPELITFHLNEPILLKNRGESAGKTILRKYPEKT